MVFYSIKATLANHQKPHSALIAPLLQSQSVTVASQIVDVLGGKSGAMTNLNSHFYNPFVYVLFSQTTQPAVY